MHSPLYTAYMWLCYAGTVFFVPYAAYKVFSVQKNKPVIAAADILYQEWFASGYSAANILTKIFAASNCLRLVVTSDCLIVTTYFPFTLFSVIFDLEHVIPLKNLQPIERKRQFLVRLLQLAYKDKHGRSHMILVAPKNLRRFLEAVGQNDPQLLSI